MMIDTEYNIQNSSIPNKQEFRYQLMHQINKINREKHQNMETKVSSHRILIATINKIKNHLTINKADKGNVFTIENKDSQIQKVTDYLDDPIFSKLKSDPIIKFQNKIKHMIKQNNLIFNGWGAKNANPSKPIFHTATKVHKQHYPIRPIVNYKSAPAYYSKKLLSHILKLKLILDKYNIKNSTELTKQLHKIKLSPNLKFISFHINNMYTNIPVKETIDIIKLQLQQLQEDNNYVQQLVNSLNTVLEQNYFVYNKEFYLQLEGLPMGSPISPIFSEIFLQYTWNSNILRK